MNLDGMTIRRLVQMCSVDIETGLKLVNAVPLPVGEGEVRMTLPAMAALLQALEVVPFRTGGRQYECFAALRKSFCPIGVGGGSKFEKPSPKHDLIFHR